MMLQIWVKDAELLSKSSSVHVYRHIALVQTWVEFCIYEALWSITFMRVSKRRLLVVIYAVFLQNIYIRGFSM